MSGPYTIRLVMSNDDDAEIHVETLDLNRLQWLLVGADPCKSKERLEIPQALEAQFYRLTRGMVTWPTLAPEERFTRFCGVRVVFVGDPQVYLDLGDGTAISVSHPSGATEFDFSVFITLLECTSIPRNELTLRIPDELWPLYEKTAHGANHWGDIPVVKGGSS